MFHWGEERPGQSGLHAAILWLSLGLPLPPLSQPADLACLRSRPFIMKSLQQMFYGWLDVLSLSALVIRHAHRFGL